MAEDFDPEAFQLQNDTSLQTVMRCRKAQRLKEAGWSDEDIAIACRLPVRLVPMAIEVANGRHEDFSDDDLNESILFLLKEQLAGLQEIFRNPGFIYDVKGELVLGPDGQPMINTERQIQAQREMSRVIEAIRRLKGSDAPQRRVLSIEELDRQRTAIRYIEELKPREIANLDIQEGEIVYDPEGDSLTLGDGGVVRDNEEGDGNQR